MIIQVPVRQDELGAMPYDDEGVPSVIVVKGRKKIRMGQYFAVGKQQDKLGHEHAACNVVVVVGLQLKT